MGRKSPAEIKKAWRHHSMSMRSAARQITVEARSLRTIIGWGCASLAGAVGWWLGDYVNIGVALILGIVASSVGLYYGQKWFDNNLG
jgi:hypothetical protein